MNDHLPFDQLSDLADAGLSSSVESTARAHLRNCEDCASRLAAIAALHASAAALPQTIAPPEDLWPTIRGAMSTRGASGRRIRWTGRQLAAAGIAIAVMSSAITAISLRGFGGPSASTTASAAAREMSTEATPAELPVSFVAAERRYAASVTALQRTLDERRASLAPTTIAIVERSLRVSDSAIAEARGALARDPGNRALAALFASNYERKIDLLRRATELAQVQ